MKKTILVALLAGLLSTQLCAASVTGTVSNIKVRADGVALVFFGDNLKIIEADNANMKTFMAMLLSAQMAGKEVTVEYYSGKIISVNIATNS